MKRPVALAAMAVLLAAPAAAQDSKPQFLTGDELKAALSGKSLRYELRSTKGGKSVNYDTTIYFAPDGKANSTSGSGTWWIQDDAALCFRVGPTQPCYKMTVRGPNAGLYDINGTYQRPASILAGDRTK